MKLYEIPKAYEEVADLLTENGGELTPEIEERLAALDGTLEEKVDAICRIIVEKRAFARARHAFGMEQVGQAAVLDRGAARLEDYLLGNLVTLGRDFVETRTAQVAVDYLDDGDLQTPVLSFVALKEGAVYEEEDPLTQKVAALVAVIRNREEMAAARKEEAERLLALAAQDDQAIAEAKESLLGLLKGNGIPKVQTASFAVRWQRNSLPSVKVAEGVDPTSLPSSITSTTEPVPPQVYVDHKKVRALWKEAGQPDELEVAAGVKVELGYHVRLK